MWHDRALGALFLAAILVAGGCSTNGDISTFEELGDEANTRGFGREFPNDPSGEALVLGPGDQLDIAVAAAETLSGPRVVRQDGRITLPVIGEVMVGGLTPEQVQQKLETLLAVYLKPPINVTVAVGQIVSKVYFVGANEPTTGGTIFTAVPYRGNTNLFDVWVAMGSPSSMLDDETHMKVIRGDVRRPDIYTINVKEMYTKGLMGGNIRIRPDDIVVVPPTLLGRIAGFVAGVSVPFQSLFQVSRTITELDLAVRIVQGDDVRRGRVF